MTTPKKRQYELLESKIEDKVIQESVRRIRQILQDLDLLIQQNTGGDTTIVNEFQGDVDGGRADSIYTAPQLVDGGNA